MSDLREKMPSGFLEIGMFIDELDRPWLESPFLLQGFVLETQEQLNSIKELCEFVYIDRSKSTGQHFKAKPKQKVAIKREGTTVRITSEGATPSVPEKKEKPVINTTPKIVVRTQEKQNKTIQQASFFEVITAIKSGSVSHNDEAIVFNMREEASSANKRQIQDNGIIYDEQERGFFDGIFGRSKAKQQDDVSDEDDDTESYRITIYDEEHPAVEQEIAVIYPTYEKSQLATKQLFEAIANEQNLDMSTVSDSLDTMIDSINRSPDALMWLAKLKAADNISYGQALNVSINMMAFASFLAFPKAEIKEMGLAGLLQDIGKLNIPRRILQKESKLSMIEYEMAKLHLDESLKILKENTDVSTLALKIIAEHHERINGTGYPNRLKGETIERTSQIAGLIDTYCAITTDRTYAPKLGNSSALDEIHRLRDQEFSDEIVDQLIQFFGIYPVSTLVELNTGEIAIVIQQNEVRRMQPRVMVILAADKSKNPFPPTLDLLHAPTTPDGVPYEIIKGIAPEEYDINLSDYYI